jgi:hypothetical protein
MYRDVKRKKYKKIKKKEKEPSPLTKKNWEKEKTEFSITGRK